MCRFARKPQSTTAGARRARLGSLILALGLLLPAAGLADAEAESRYPYDPACPWGRLANGKGMLHRCLSQAEAKSLFESGTGSAKPTGPASPSEREPAEQEPKESSSSLADFELSVGPIEAEEGSLGVGALGKPIDRYKQCVQQHGGLQKPRAKVVVRFLVRAERGRAEGTEVDSFEGLSKSAARCIADVVDRRRVGTPEVPLTGARLTFQINQQP